MRILIDIGHPGHVHLFKHFAWEMQEKGHKVFFTCREKEFEIYLLEKYGFEYKSFGKKYNSKAGKLWGMVIFDVKEFLSGLKFKPDVLLSHGSIYAAHAAFLLRKPHIALEDTGNMEQVRLYLPFTSNVLTADVFPYDYGKKQIRYPGHHELAYLHPKKFIPDKTIYDKFFEDNLPIALLRFVAWNASHDYKQQGLSLDEKKGIIKFLEESGFKIIISSEGELPDNLKKYSASFSPDEIHHVLYYSNLFIGEGTTMAMEAAILGTPAIYVNTLQYANCADLEKYGLLFNYRSFDGIIDKLREISLNPKIKNDLKVSVNNMLKDKIDVSSFLIWFVINYPMSASRAKNADDNFWSKFK